MAAPATLAADRSTSSASTPADAGFKVADPATAPGKGRSGDGSTLGDRLREHNRRLAEAGIGLRLDQRRQRLGLRGPLPCRHGEGLKVQRISLGLTASDRGLIEAQAQLKRVLQQLASQSFQWSDWSRQDPGGRDAGAAGPGGGAGSPAPCLALDRQLEEFESSFFADPRRRRQPAGSRTTWSSAYKPYLRRLQRLSTERSDLQQPNGALSIDLLEAVLESYPLASRARQQCGTALAALARQAGVEIPRDWSSRAGGYGLHAARFRQLPSDGEILSLVERIPNPGWRLAYGLMATYGLRNHEVFFCDLRALAPGGDQVLRVLPTSKTGEHQVWPFQPEWVERFGLQRLGQDPGALPPVSTDLRHTTLQQTGRRVAEQFRRYALPITPYDLRHAWALRTIHIGLPDTVAARMMGHSVAIHTRTYHHWITRRDQQQAVDRALGRR
ncbi:MAG: site-specific integrase [Cyanobacteriota bacterium]